jgi:hypothetical protein
MRSAGWSHGAIVVPCFHNRSYCAQVAAKPYQSAPVASLRASRTTSASRVSESFCQQPGGLDCDGASRGLPWRQQAMLENLQDLQGLKGETAAGDKSQTEQFLLACLVLYSPRASFSSPALPCHLCATAQNLRARWLKAPTTSILVHQRPTHMTTDKDLKHLQGRQPAMLSALDTWLGCCYRRFG